MTSIQVHQLSMELALYLRFDINSSSSAQYGACSLPQVWHQFKFISSVWSLLFTSGLTSIQVYQLSMEFALYFRFDINSSSSAQYGFCSLPQVWHQFKFISSVWSWLFTSGLTSIQVHQLSMELALYLRFDINSSLSAKYGACSLPQVWHNLYFPLLKGKENLKKKFRFTWYQ